jgi:hypothetical protein
LSQLSQCKYEVIRLSKQGVTVETLYICKTLCFVFEFTLSHSITDYRRSFGLDIGFIDYFGTKLLITFNYSTIASFDTLQITTARAKCFPARRVFTSSCLVTASINGYSPASVLKSSLNDGLLPTEIFVLQLSSL